MALSRSRLPDFTCQRIQFIEVIKSFHLQDIFIYVMLMVYAEFQYSTMPGTGQKVCGGRWVSNPILVFSLAKAEQLFI